jgi:Arc/MetJ-type ribon-helix-helix transcriptional regulator
MPTSVRLDEHTEALIAELARRRRQTRSAVIREAIAELARREVQAARPYDAFVPWIGCADSGGAELSKGTGTRFRAMLEEKRRARGAG